MTKEDKLELMEQLKYISTGRFDDDSVLDKIRAEIADIYCGQYCEDPITASELKEQVLEIIDKYSEESEE